MGNDQSQIPGIEIDQRVIEVSDFWAQHSATINNLENVSKLTIFAGDLFLSEPFWSPHTPLEKFSKNLMIYRHPSIIRYISSWQKACKFYLAVEDLIPLSHIISQMNTTEICLGLYSILKALCFLHEKALASHNNVCMSSIFVGREGNWKLGGLEYLCRYKDISGEFLKKSRSHRYSKAVDTNEETHLKNSSERKDFIDVFSFCTLVIELLRNKSDDDFPNVSAVKEYCTRVIQEPNILQRPKLSTILEHDFFKHRFIGIHSFLIELPLKSDIEKTDFFTNVKHELEELEEEIVASQLGRLLVSRMVLLNKQARDFLLPYVLMPRKDENGALFSEEVFKKYISPKILNIICVRDVQIRLLLLEYFPHFIDCFTKEQLQLNILPELLLGIKDTNNELVAATLHTLAQLVPVLGANVVIGRNRAKLFNDGRPKHHGSSRKNSRANKHELSKAENVSTVEPDVSNTSSIIELIHHQEDLPERPRPDGEEGETSTDEIEQVEDDVDNWEEWGQENNSDTNEIILDNCQSETSLLSVQTPKSSIPAVSNRTSTLLDITELDIKNQTKVALQQNEVDFFEDMEPVIEASSKFLISNSDFSTKLSVNVEDTSEDGWGEEWE